MANVCGATLYTSNQVSSGSTRCSVLYSGRGNALHQSGVYAEVCAVADKERKRLNTESTEIRAQRTQRRFSPDFSLPDKFRGITRPPDRRFLPRDNLGVLSLLASLILFYIREISVANSFSVFSVLLSLRPLC